MDGGVGALLLLAVLAAGVVAITRFALITGIGWAADAWAIRPKNRGRVLGYATSAPELVGTISTAARGLLGAGLWNVASSNVINLLLFAGASAYYGRVRALAQRRFVDEAAFAVGAIAIPALLAYRRDWAGTAWVACALLVLFAGYLVVDARLNPPERAEVRPAAGAPGWRGPAGVALALLGIAGIAILGDRLGAAADTIVRSYGVPEAAIGWILGLVTSLPELTSFFAVFATGRHLPGDADCQQNLDNLAASNVANVGLIYPIGVFVFLALAGGG